MKNLTLILLFTSCIISTISAQAQTQTISSEAARLTILHTYTEEFPRLSVVFKAEKANGEPVYDLNNNNMHVVENGKSCEVISVKPVASTKPIYVSIVIDHSGSMEEDPSQLYDKSGKPLFTVDANENMIVPDNYTAPIENARVAVKSFVSSFNAKKDQISVTGFSSSVDGQVALTRSYGKINSAVEAMKAEGKTALYDGMITGLTQLNSVKDEIKVLVVLTDGQDNRSKSAWTDVAAMAQEHNVPVYIIGLGEVNKGALEKIAEETGGEFYYTNTSTSLQTIYSTISKRVQTFYQVVYNSTLAAATTGEIALASGNVTSNTQSFQIPTGNVSTTAEEAVSQESPAVSAVTEQPVAASAEKTPAKIAGMNSAIDNNTSSNTPWILIGILLIAGSSAVAYNLSRKPKHVLENTGA